MQKIIPILAMAMLCLAGTSAYAATVYVDHSATGSNNGTSWANAYTSLNTGLQNASSGDEVWIAEGTYTPGSSRGNHFSHPNGCQVYGGFDGTEALLSQRDWWNNPTILSGDIGTLNDNSDNTYQIYDVDGQNSANLLDGVFITGGNANGSGSSNKGGAILVRNPGSNGFAIEVRNCVLYDNTSQDQAGAVFVGYYMEVTFNNCIFKGNSTRNGGAIYADDEAITNCINCSFNGNSASVRGKTLFMDHDGTMNFENSIIWGETGAATDEVYGKTPYINNDHNIFPSSWLGGTTPNSNTSTSEINSDPQYANSNLELLSNSPGINAGDQTLNSLTVDLQGNSRVEGGQIDLGAHELANCIVYVDTDATGSNSGTSWTNAYTSLVNGLQNATAGCEVWIAEGTYSPGAARGNHFSHPNGVKVYGGFDATETALNQRDWWSHQTILSGDIGTLGDPTDNTYQLYDVDGQDADNLLDGVTITGGYADGLASWNKGGAVLVRTPSTMGFAIELKNIRFMVNNAQDLAGAVFVGTGMEVVFTHCIFVENTTRNGGAVYADDEAIISFLNCSFESNAASVRGNSIYLDNDATLNLRNTIVWGGGGAAADEVYGKTPYISCDYNVLPSPWLGGTTPNSYASANEINSDPLYANGELELSSGSPALNSGNNIYNTLDLDIKASDRIQNSTIDMGAHESGTYKKDGTTGLEDANAHTFAVYPNPATEGSVTIAFEAGTVDALRIFTSTGQLVYSETQLSGTSQHTVQGLSKGTYWVEVRSHNTTQRQALMVQ